MDDRRFEQYVTDLYKQEIENNKFTGRYDEVLLMPGVGEQGRDCVLKKEGKTYGIIQCKCYNRNLELPECTKEIVKFCLYAILRPEMIFDRTVFEYYLISSNGFSTTAIDSLPDFKGLISSEKKLEGWVRQVIEENKTLKEQFTFEDIQAELYDILTSIKIILVDGNELDRLLSFSYNTNLQEKYFDVKKVIDHSALEPVDKKLNEIIENSRPVYGNELIEIYGFHPLLFIQIKTISGILKIHIFSGENSKSW
ncbi:MAG: hypothetical protein LUE98_20495 [Tannerellaceae bacterium]|nr:hypothetical protein [Tannerellaceae bacterium]